MDPGHGLPNEMDRAMAFRSMYGEATQPQVSPRAQGLPSQLGGMQLSQLQLQHAQMAQLSGGDNPQGQPGQPIGTGQMPQVQQTEMEMLRRTLFEFLTENEALRSALTDNNTPGGGGGQIVDPRLAALVFQQQQLQAQQQQAGHPDGTMQELTQEAEAQMAHEQAQQDGREMNHLSGAQQQQMAQQQAQQMAQHQAQQHAQMQAQYMAQQAQMVQLAHEQAHHEQAHQMAHQQAQMVQHAQMQAQQMNFMPYAQVQPYYSGYDHVNAMAQRQLHMGQMAPNPRQEALDRYREKKRRRLTLPQVSGARYHKMKEVADGKKRSSSGKFVKKTPALALPAPVALPINAAEPAAKDNRSDAAEPAAKDKSAASPGALGPGVGRSNGAVVAKPAVVKPQAKSGPQPPTDPAPP